MKIKVKVSYNSPVTLTFVLLAGVITLLGTLTNDGITKLLFSVYRDDSFSLLYAVRLFTHAFGHSGFEHYFANAMYLLLLGPMLEEKYGSKTMLVMMIITAGVTGTAHCLFFGNYSLCGASGIVFACILMSSFTAFKHGEIPLSFILVSVLFFGREVLDGIMIRDNISNTTHIMGGIVGSVCGYILNKSNK